MSTHGAHRRFLLSEVDAHLRAWIGVSFALLALDLGMAADLLRARARLLGLKVLEA